MAWPAVEAAAFRADVKGNFLATLELVPVLAEAVAGGERVRPFVGTADLPNFFREPSGPGWALIGDTGSHKDPFLAQGIADAFRDAELLAEAVDAGLSGSQPLDEALAGYEQRRNRAAMPGYELNARLATLEPPSGDLARVLDTVRNSQEETDFLGTLAGAVLVEEFFPEATLAAAAPSTGEARPVH